MKKHIAKPFVKWVGGKTQLINDIEKLLPKDFSLQKDLTYIEPFVGGGAILFWILQKYPNIKKAIINDINSNLTSTYTIIKDKPNKLISALKDIENTYCTLDESKRKDYFLIQRQRFNKERLSKIENSALFIFLNRTCFNGLYRENSKGEFNVPFGKYKNPLICDEETILKDSSLLQKVDILTGDFEKTLSFANENTFFYLDPPYKPITTTSSFTSYSKETFNDNEQIRLGEFCNKISSLKSNFILSNSDVKTFQDDNFFEDIYSQFQIQRVLASRMINAKADKRGKLNELIITNIENTNLIRV
jgi:DNA adenine methylase